MEDDIAISSAILLNRFGTDFLSQFSRYSCSPSNRVFFMKAVRETALSSFLARPGPWMRRALLLAR